MDQLPALEELESLRTSLTGDDCDQLRQELLVAMAHGEEALASAIDVWLLYRAMRELITNPVVGPGVGADYPTGGTDDSWSRGRRRDRWAAG